jgi:hypothetical protein
VRYSSLSTGKPVNPPPDAGRGGMLHSSRVRDTKRSQEKMDEWTVKVLKNLARIYY